MIELAGISPSKQMTLNRAGRKDLLKHTSVLYVYQLLNGEPYPDNTIQTGRAASWQSRQDFYPPHEAL